MPERFLILGPRSFYGSSFIKLAMEKGDEVIECGFDIDKPWILDRNLVDGSIVVNFISRSLVAESWDNPASWTTTNVTSTTKLVDKLKNTAIKKFIHVSTPEVYGSTPDWVDETYTDWKPSTPYAVSRAAGDMMLKAYHKAYGFPAIITRTANIYGPGQQNYRLIPTACSKKASGEAMALHGDGQSIRTFIHIKDACEATYKICKEGEVWETYHISTNKAHSIKEVVEMIGCKYEPAPERLGKDYAYLLNSDKLRAMGWKDTITLEQGLCELLR
jgi:dTDP-glucose 4,6-dehydratase